MRTEPDHVDRFRPHRRAGQLVLACAVLGAGVAMMLNARLGSDGYSMFVNGLSIATGVEFAVVNVVVAVVLVLLAWSRGLRPGIGTVVQPVVVGVTVSGQMAALPTPDGSSDRWLLFAAGYAVLCLGVAGYLAVELGAGPAEAVAAAWDPPVPFRWGYSIAQVAMGLTGWLLGADLGPGTLIVVILIGPVVARLIPVLAPRRPSSGETVGPGPTQPGT